MITQNNKRWEMINHKRRQFITWKVVLLSSITHNIIGWKKKVNNCNVCQKNFYIRRQGKNIKQGKLWLYNLVCFHLILLLSSSCASGKFEIQFYSIINARDCGIPNSMVVWQLMVMHKSICKKCKHKNCSFCASKIIHHK